MAQWNIPIHLLNEYDNRVVIENFQSFKEIYKNLLKLSLDFNEYDYFKMIVLSKLGRLISSCIFFVLTISLLYLDKNFSTSGEANSIKIFHNSLIHSLVEYEKTKSVFLNNFKKSNEINEKARLNELLVFLNSQLNNLIFDETFEKVFFKNFIGSLNMRKILTEMLVNQINF